MSSIGKDLTEWLRAQPEWMQTAAELHLSAGGLTETDIDALVDSLKGAAGPSPAGTRTFAGLTPSASLDADLRLLAIGPIRGIENLGPRAPLSLGAGNLSVVYGHNGSGKSSYTRLLKKVCGKPRAAELRPNVFDEHPPATRDCKLLYSVDGDKVSVTWGASDPPVDHLRAVDIFDADAALSYLQGESSVSYVPPSVALLEALAVVCDRVKLRLEQEEARLVKALPAIPPEFARTKTGEALQKLTSNTSPGSLVTWTPEDEAALAAVTARLATPDPAAEARSKTARKARIDQIVDHIKTVVRALSPDALSALRALRDEQTRKRVIATESAGAASSAFEGVGSPTWRAMWQAAREYSAVVYPERDYPVTDDALCVLCQQPLDSDAQRRLEAFETFVQGKLEAEAAAAEGEYQRAVQRLPVAWAEDEILTRCQAAGLTEDEWARSIAMFCVSAEVSRRGLATGESEGSAVPVESPSELLERLRSRSTALEAEAKSHERDATDVDREQVERQKRELEARRWAAQQAVAIGAEIARLKKVDSYKAWKRLANSRSVSTKAAEVAKLAITQAFVDRFNDELKKLGASHIRVEITSRVAKGKALHRLRLKGAQAQEEKYLDAVLSEGERRIVALAAFLADVVTQPQPAPFVFDDPISSLDHDFEWAVANRLAELARDRQVLVLTHRLSLYGAMEDAAKKHGESWKDKNLSRLCIESFGGTAGHPADQEVWQQSTKESNKTLLKRLAVAREAGGSSGAAAYRALAQGICSDFRKLLERTIEEDLLSKVVIRHRRSITTQGRLERLPRITPKDCKFFDDLLTKYSCYEHSQSTETPVLLPEEPELRADLESLRDWRTEFTRRPSAPDG